MEDQHETCISAHDESVKGGHLWIDEVGPKLFLVTHVDVEGDEHFVDALSGDLLEVSSTIDRRFPSMVVWGPVAQDDP